MGGHRGYDFWLDPNQKGGKRKKRVLSASGAARQLARNELRLRLLRQLKKSNGAHQHGGMWEIDLPEGGKKKETTRRYVENGLWYGSCPRHYASGFTVVRRSVRKRSTAATAVAALQVLPGVVRSRKF